MLSWSVARLVGPWVIAGAAVLYGYVQGERLENCKVSHRLFVAQVEAVGNEQNRKAAETAARDLRRKEIADAENIDTRARLDAATRKLRDAADSRRSELPPAPAGSNRPDLACFDRAEYQRENGAAVRRLREGARRLADEGAASTVDLNTAKKWAQGAHGNH